jgi:hypothetical protein
MLMQMVILAAIAGWAFDDWCPTPPRPPWPWPGPWPWLRKILALVGGGLAYVVFQGNVINEAADVLTAVFVGGVGGVFVASLGSAFTGGRDVRG